MSIEKMINRIDNDKLKQEISNVINDMNRNSTEKSQAILKIGKKNLDYTSLLADIAISLRDKKWAKKNKRYDLAIIHSCPRFIPKDNPYKKR